MRLVVLALALATASGSAQTQEVLFPGQRGDDLIASIRAAYRPAAITGDNDDLYARIDSVTVGGQLGVRCVYTGLFVPFDGVPSSDPSQDIGNGFSQTGEGLNREHTWPNSLLSGLARDDLHNLFPTQVGVNSDRGNDRFAEIPDAQATRWYRGAPPYTQTSPPTEALDEYSEIRSDISFEPREDHKGNVARALFYMAAVYGPSTNGDFPFDAADRQTLFDWHRADPITEADQGRSARVAAFQSGRDNPFVLDSTLVRRAFFPDLVGTDTEAAPAGLALRLAGPNPFRTEARLVLSLPEAAPVTAEAFDALGRRVAVLYDGPAAGEVALRLGGAGLAPGVYRVRVVAGGIVLTRRLVRTR
ncbi:MAG: endonuclease [Bacteroidota bacterium]